MMRRVWPALIAVAVGSSVAACSATPTALPTPSADMRELTGPRPSIALTPATTEDVRPCRLADLQVSLGPSGVAAGTSYQQIDYRNDSSLPCSLAGYPGARFVGGAGAAVGRPAVPTNVMGTSETAVVLSPGETGHNSIGIAATANFPRTRCHPTAAAALHLSDSSRGFRRLGLWCHPASARRSR